MMQQDDRSAVVGAIQSLLAHQPRVLVSIDGPCACGKSTLGQWLADEFCCPLIHMDDFFLAPHQRSPQRLEQPGENVDHLRFRREVLDPLLRGETVRYRPWQCRSACFGPEVVLPPAPLVVVEGAYALRPNLRDAYDLRIFLTAPWAVRQARLRQRGGEGCLQRFLDQWIPLENQYFQAFQVPQCCHMILSGTD